MDDDFLTGLKEKISSSRLGIISFIMILFSLILIFRLFVLQIVKGSDYQSNYVMKIEKKETIEANRGNIYDRNGKLLAYNELSYNVTIINNYTHESLKKSNQHLNSELYTLISGILKNGDDIDNDFGIIQNADKSYSFKDSGINLLRFKADIFGHKSIDDLTYNKKAGFNEADAGAKEIMTYLMGSQKYNISKKLPEEIRYRIAVIRYKISLNSFKVYMPTVVASSISDKSLAFVKENSLEMPGVTIKEKSVRKYTDGKYFAHIIGYTGTISTEEFKKRSAQNKNVEQDDIIGKAGIEQYMDKYLSGKKGYDTLIVDNVGNPIKTTKHVESESGGNVYLSIDKDLQERAYNLLEQEIAGILVAKLKDSKTVERSDESKNQSISIYDAYVNLLLNRIVDTDHFKEADASDLEKNILSEYQAKEADVRNSLQGYLAASNTVPISKADDEYYSYLKCVVNMLKDQKILVKDRIDTDDDTYKSYSQGNISLSEYLKYAIKKNWIDITQLKEKSRYVDTDEIYQSLLDYINKNLPDYSSYQKAVYKNAVLQGSISGNQICAALFDQGVLPRDDDTRNALLNGRTSAFSFLVDKIKTLQIEPGQLGLKPCSGSCVVTDVTTGEILACVSYPGYDNNNLANKVDSDYYSYLVNSSASPLYNNATQQRTAPGSTFKMLTSTAGMAEGVITPETEITCTGQFEKISNKPKCWIYPGSHGTISLSEAIKDSCNCFFYEVGWRLSGGDNNYNDGNGIKKLTKYAELYGLTSKTGVEITESKSDYATQYPVMAAIGQSNNNITTIALSRYVTAVANSGTVYNMTLLKSVTDHKGKTIKTYSPSVKNTVDVLNPAQWSAIHTGMRMVVEHTSSFDGFPVAVCGKTGTAQESKTAPDHVLFVGYAPEDSPKYAMAIRLANGFQSSYAAAVGKDIMGCIYNVPDSVSKADSGNALNLENGIAGD